MQGCEGNVPPAKAPAPGADDAYGVKVFYRILKEPGMSPNDAIVFGYLYSFEETPGKQAFPRRKEIAARLGLTVGQVDRCLKKLKEAGFLVVVERFGEDGRQRSNLYRTNLYASRISIVQDPPSTSVGSPPPHSQGAPLPVDREHTKSRSTKSPPIGGRGSAPVPASSPGKPSRELYAKWWGAFDGEFRQRYGFRPASTGQDQRELTRALEAGDLDDHENTAEIVPLVFDYLDDMARDLGRTPGTIVSMSTFLRHRVAAMLAKQGGVEEDPSERAHRLLEERTQAYLREMRGGRAG